jgi:hypothetical protein
LTPGSPSQVHISPNSPRSSSEKRKYWPLLLICVIGIVLLGLANIRGIPGLASTSTFAMEVNPLLSRVFPSGGLTTIIVGDACVAFMHDHSGPGITLEEYLQNGETLASPIARREPPSLPGCMKGLTSYEDMHSANRLVKALAPRGSTIVVRHPRDVNIRDFENNNFMLIGDPLADPWYELWSPYLNYIFEPAGAGVHIRSRSPAKGDPFIYAPTRENRQTQYVVLSVVPNLRETGSILLLFGTSAEATKDVVELVGQTRLPPELNQLLLRASKPTTSLEIVMQVDNASGVPGGWKVLASRFYATRRPLR